MEKDMQKKIREDMEATALQLRSVSDSAAFVEEFGAFLGRMEETFARIVHRESDADNKTEAVLYRRALRDYFALQKHLSPLRNQLSSKRAFMHLLQGRGRDKAKALQHIQVVDQLDHALGDLVHLMQYHESDRCEIDVRNGFQLTCGSVNYGRMRFAQKGEEVDD